jgi:hypothetical protein
VSSEARAKYPKLNILESVPRPGTLRISVREAAAALFALLAVSYVVYYYFSVVRPARARLAEVTRRYDEQLETIRRHRTESGAGKPSIVDQVNLARESLERFKTDRLKPLHSGRRTIFDEINTLSKKHGVSLTSGIQVAQTEKKESEKKGKLSSIDDLLVAYPMLEFQFTAAGSYENLRKLLNELERSSQFVVFKSVNIAAVDQVEGQGRRAVATGGQAVALSVTMIGYFSPAR